MSATILLFHGLHGSEFPNIIIIIVRDGGREREKGEGIRDGEREGGREEVRERGREGGSEGGREGGREEGKKGGRK